MYRKLLVSISFALVFQPIAIAEDQIHFGDFAVTSPEGYGIRTAGNSLAIVDDARGITVELFRFERLPAPTKQAVASAVLRHKDTDEVVVQRAEASEQHGEKCTYAEGTAKIKGVKSRFWFLSMNGRGRVMTALAHAAAELDPASVTEIEFIIDSLRREKKAAAIEVREFFDFEPPEQSADWITQGRITAARKIPPRPFRSSDAGPNGAAAARVPKQQAVRLQADGQTGFFTKAQLVPEDWTDLDSVSFWVLREASADRPTTVELQVMEPDTRVRFWRKIVIDHDGWKRYTVPLKWMRWSAIGVPSWKNVDRLGFWFREGGDVWIDSIALEDHDPAQGAALIADDVQAIAFPDEKQNAKVVSNDAVTIITNTTELNAEQLANHLQQVRQAIQADLSFVAFENTSDAPIFLISPTRQAHEKFASALASAFNSEFGLPLGDAVTLQDVSMSYWDAQWGTLRPAYTNQYVRAVLGRAVELTDRGEWLHEGMASRYHHKYHPQKDFNKFIQESLARPDRLAPFTELCNGKSISKRHSWQAMTLVDMLLTHQDYRGHLPKFVEIIRSSGSTNLNPALQPVFGQSPEELTNDWREHCEKSYPAKSDKNVAQAG